MKNSIQFSPKIISLCFGILVCLFLAAFYIFAWTEPTTAPPGGNVPAPLNTGSSAQTKTGNLTLPNIYLNALGNEGNIYNLNWIVGYNDLYLKGNSAESAVVHIAGSQLSFWSSGEKWRIDSAGSLAIGSVPWARLTGFPSACAAGQYVTAVGSMLACSAPAGGISGRGTANYVSKWTSATALGDSQIFDNGTNVGIGTTGPVIRLAIGDTDTGLHWISDGNLAVYTNNVERIRINSAGNVGIGTASPNRLLRVNGDVGATAYYYDSDISLKKDILPLENSLEKVLQLQGVSFNWKDSDGPSIGLVAQDVEKIFPEVVSGGEPEGLKAIEYGKLIAPLIEAIKEQQKEIGELKIEINELRLKLE